MAELTRAAFISKYQGLFADNITREISEADMREFAEDIKDSFINGLEYSPSSSFGGLTGEVTDSQKLVQWGNEIISLIRGGAQPQHNTLQKLWAYMFLLYETHTNQFAIGDNVNNVFLFAKIGKSYRPALRFSIPENRWTFSNDGINYYNLPTPSELSDIDGGASDDPNKRIKPRRGLYSEWTDANPVLGDGELAIETDTKKAKFGDGVNTYNNLEYWFDGSTNLKFKGYFEDETDLETQYPTGDIGDTAINLDTNTFWMWNVDTSEWVDSSKPVPAFVIDSVLTEGSANAAPSGGTFTAIANLMSLISGLADDLEAIETEVGEIDVVQKWVSVNAVSNTVTFDLQNKLNKFFNYTASANYTWEFINDSYAADDVVNIQFEIYFPTGVTSHVITLPSGDNVDSNGQPIDTIELTGSEETKVTAYGQRNGSTWKYWWSQTNIIDGGTT